MAGTAREIRLLGLVTPLDFQILGNSGRKEDERGRKRERKRRIHGPYVIMCATLCVPVCMSRSVYLFIYFFSLSVYSFICIYIFSLSIHSSLSLSFLPSTLPTHSPLSLSISPRHFLISLSFPYPYFREREIATKGLQGRKTANDGQLIGKAILVSKIINLCPGVCGDYCCCIFFYIFLYFITFSSLLVCL